MTSQILKFIRYHSPDFLFSFTRTRDFVLLTLRDLRLIDLIRASGIRENLGESTLFSGMKKFLTANIVIVTDSQSFVFLIAHSHPPILNCTIHLNRFYNDLTVFNHSICSIYCFVSPFWSTTIVLGDHYAKHEGVSAALYRRGVLERRAIRPLS